MNRQVVSAIALAVAALSAGQAFAQGTYSTAPEPVAFVGNLHNYPPEQAAGPGLTRAQVKAQLVEAIRHGDMVANEKTGQTYRDLFPDRYPAGPVIQGKTRAQVQAELAEAERTGDIVANGDEYRMLNQAYPNRYPLTATH